MKNTEIQNDLPGDLPAYEDLRVATTLVCRGEPQDDDDNELLGDGSCILARDGAGPLVIPIFSADARKRPAHEKARVLAKHYGMPVRVVSFASLVRQFPDSPIAELAKEAEKEDGVSIGHSDWPPKI
jgi:hypothetical protein